MGLASIAAEGVSEQSPKPEWMRLTAMEALRSQAGGGAGCGTLWEEFLRKWGLYYTLKISDKQRRASWHRNIQSRLRWLVPGVEGGVGICGVASHVGP